MSGSYLLITGADGWQLVDNLEFLFNYAKICIDRVRAVLSDHGRSRAVDFLVDNL